MTIVKLFATVALLDYSDTQLKQALRFAKLFPTSSSENRVLCCELILEARKHRASGVAAYVRIAERYEAEVYEILFFKTDETHNTINQPLYAEAAL